MAGTKIGLQYFLADPGIIMKINPHQHNKDDGHVGFYEFFYSMGYVLFCV
jgi:hypothetical protein